MKSITDPLVSSTHFDRLHYATGELLGADDFRDEQTYHRRQLARALLHLAGGGVIAGLRVLPEHRPGASGVPDEVELKVRPGIALDHAGRLIEVPADACLRLRRWYEYIAAGAPDSVGLDAGNLRAAWRVDATVAAGGVVVADVFLAFHPCARGYTPAFASGPFDALDASQPSRIRDGYELSLVLRTEADDAIPTRTDPWAAIAGATLDDRLASAKDISMGRWQSGAETAVENPLGVDPTAILLARLRIPARPNPSAAQAPIPDWANTAWPDTNTNINNQVRHVVLPPEAAHRLRP